MRALGAYIYAGGHTVGARRAGFEVDCHLEDGEFGAETSRRNLGVEVRTDPRAWRAEEFGPDGAAGPVGWLYGNPPCAAWSAAGHRRGAADERMACTASLFSLLPVVRPPVFSWECVTNVLRDGREYLGERCREVHALGYDAHLVALEVADLGLPSMRRRHFFVASRLALDFERPSARRVTVGEALAGLAERRCDVGPCASVSAEFRALIAAMPVGRKNGSVRNFAESAEGAAARGRFSPGFAQKRCRLDAPAYTVMGGSHLWHPTEARKLSVREQQVLAGYPPEYEFTGGTEGRYVQIGRAVTPPAAEWLGRAVARSLARGSWVAGGRTLGHDFVGGAVPPSVGPVTVELVRYPPVTT